ncbi:MAG: hypothetical protein HY814_06280 [Candidatus Riflebacteria bacterium]|nr:hypothetical protein [Candidatus Riflebacteria bacterium]
MTSATARRDDIGNGPPIAPGQEFDISGYYPIEVGNIWKYQDMALNGLKFKMEIKKRVPVNGVSAVFNERDDRIETDTYTNDANGFLLHSQERTNTDGSIFRATWTPGVKFVDKVTKIGAKYTTVPGFLNPGTGNKMTWVSTIMGVQEVTVPADKFKNCVKIKLLVTDTVLGVKLSDLEMWIANGLGPVKRQGNFFGVYLVQNLLEYKIIKPGKH